MNKNLMIFAMLSVIVIAGVASAFWPFTEQVKNSPYLNANACSADGTCEVNSIGPAKGLEFVSIAGPLVGKQDIISYGGHYIGNPEQDLFTRLFMYGPDLQIDVHAGKNDTARVHFLDNVVFDLATTTQKATVTNMAGNGSAYACVNAAGTFFRSAKACV